MAIIAQLRTLCGCTKTVAVDEIAGCPPHHVRVAIAEQPRWLLPDGQTRVLHRTRTFVLERWTHESTCGQATAAYLESSTD